MLFCSQKRGIRRQWLGMIDEKYDRSQLGVVDGCHGPGSCGR